MEFLRGKLAPVGGILVAALKRRWATQSKARRAAGVAILALFAALALASAAGVASARFPALEVFGNLQGHLAAAALVAAAAGVFARSKACAAVAVAALAANLGAIGYRVASADTCAVQTAAGGHRAVRVMTLNIRGGNRDFAAVERVLARQSPDILVLQELRPEHAALLDRLRSRYPHQIVCDAHPDCGIGVLSKYRLRPRRIVGNESIMAVETGVALANRELVLFATHMQRPFAGNGQSSQFQAITDQVRALPANSVVAGDFNSALWSANLSRYVKGAGVCACNATHATWPEWLGPFGVPIDHVFLKKGVRLLSIATVSGTGSDHRALLATVGIL